MAKKVLLFLNGESGTGKTFFKENIVPQGVFHNLVSATTRKKRAEEVDGVSYYFRDEKYFETEKFATHLFVNEDFWKAGEPKWLYGVPEFEIQNNLGKNLIYDVIQPRYTRELIDWCVQHHLDLFYDFYVAWFTTEIVDNIEIAKQRAVMSNDIAVRLKNTCNMEDFQAANIKPDFITRPRDNKPNIKLIDFVRHTAPDKICPAVSKIKQFTHTNLLKPSRQYEN